MCAPQAERSGPRLAIGIEVRTAREQLVILQSPATLVTDKSTHLWGVTAPPGPDFDARGGMPRSACVRTQPVTLRVRVSLKLDTAGRDPVASANPVASAAAAPNPCHPDAAAAAAAPGAGSAAGTPLSVSDEDEDDATGAGDGDNLDRAAHRGGDRGGKRPRLEVAGSADADAPPSPTAAGAAAGNSTATAAAAAAATAAAAAVGLSSVDDARLQGLVTTIEAELWEIFKGKRESQRHQLYRQKGAGRASLRALVFCGAFSAHQQEVVLSRLIRTFCADKKREKYMKCVSGPPSFLLPPHQNRRHRRVAELTRSPHLPPPPPPHTLRVVGWVSLSPPSIAARYVADVLFPETLIRMAMQVAALTYPQAEELLEKTAAAPPPD